MFLMDIAWLFTGGILWNVSRESRHYIGSHAYAGYAASLLILSVTILQMLGTYGSR